MFGNSEKLTNKRASAFGFFSPELVESMSRFSQQMAGIGKAMEDISRYVVDTHKLINALIPPELPQIMDRLRDYLKVKSISIPFTECGLWLAPSMTLAVVKTILRAYEQGQKRAIPAIVEGFYRRNGYQHLKQAVSNWSSYSSFSARMHIFYDALDAHINRKWTLSVPSLLPHIEGIAGEILLANKLPLSKDLIIVDTGYKTYPSSVFGKLSADKVTPTMDVAITSLLNYLEGTLYEYKKFEDYPKIRRLRTLNRHAVLHGYQLNYATRLHSLRCFLALDSLSMLERNIPRLVD